MSISRPSARRAPRTLLLAPALLIAALAAGAAQAQAPTVQQRIQNQEKRISNGVANGTMTPGQAAHERENEARIEAARERDRAKNGGHLTPQEKAKLEHRLNHNNQMIHTDKHPG